MKPGKYKALVVSKAVTENSKKALQVVIQLEVDFDGEKQNMNYYGQLGEKSAEYTLKALVACGIKGNSVVDPITEGAEVSVTINEEMDLNGKPRLKVAFINKPLSLGTPVDETMGRANLKQFEGALAKLRQGGVVVNHAAKYSKEEIPF